MASHEAEAEAATAGAGAMSLRTTGTGGAWTATAGWAEAALSLFEQPEARNAARPMAAVTNVVKRSVFIGPSISGWNLSPPGGLRKWGYHPMRSRRDWSRSSPGAWVRGGLQSKCLTHGFSRPTLWSVEVSNARSETAEVETRLAPTCGPPDGAGGERIARAGRRPK